MARKKGPFDHLKNMQNNERSGIFGGPKHPGGGNNAPGIGIIPVDPKGGGNVQPPGGPEREPQNAGWASNAYKPLGQTQSAQNTQIGPGSDVPGADGGGGDMEEYFPGMECFNFSGQEIDCGGCPPGSTIASTGACGPGAPDEGEEEEDFDTGSTDCYNLMGQSLPCGDCPPGSMINNGMCMGGGDDDTGDDEICYDLLGGQIPCSEADDSGNCTMNCSDGCSYAIDCGNSASGSTFYNGEPCCPDTGGDGCEPQYNLLGQCIACCG